MAIPKKGSRKIVVDGIAYRWRIRWKPSISTQDCFSAGLTAAVELYDEPRGVLMICFTHSSYKHYPSMQIEPVTPTHVKTAIETAIEKGWIPADKGSFDLLQD